MQHQRRELYPLMQEYIQQYQDKYGAAPTLKEIAAHMNMSSASAWRYIQAMKNEGLIDRNGTRMMATVQDKKASEPTRPVPTVGSISCGLPLLAEENIEEYVRLPKSWIGSGDNVFILRAEGHSMINAGIDTGDLVIIRQQATAEPGQIVVALVDDETATLKRYRPIPEKNIVELVPENNAFDVQVIDLTERRLAIQGIAIGVYKNFDVK